MNGIILLNKIEINSFISVFLSCWLLFLSVCCNKWGISSFGNVKSYGNVFILFLGVAVLFDGLAIELVTLLNTFKLVKLLNTFELVALLNTFEFQIEKSKTILHFIKRINAKGLQTNNSSLFPKITN